MTYVGKPRETGTERKAAGNHAVFFNVLLSVWFLLTFCAAAEAQIPKLTLVPALTNLSHPVFLTNAKDGSNRRFVVEQEGRIRVLQPGAATSTLFLDITSRVLFGGERGLLGLAFHPQFSMNGRFYVDYTRRPDGATVVAEYRNGVEQRILFTVPQPYENHKGGMIEFGPDGYLYVGMGDGGSGNDPENRAQNLNEFLGKILRINVDVPDSRPEIFAYGFRNPWRFSFDRLTGQLYVGDVGQNAREEIDIVTQRGNYGWRVWEGTFCTGLGPAPCSEPAFIVPIADYVNGSNGRCAIIGGYLYRGTQASLPYGAYVFGDLCSGEIFMLKDRAQTILLDTPFQLSSFGEDEAGEIYVVDEGGSIFRLANTDAVAGPERSYAMPDSNPFVSSTAGSASAVKVGYGRIQAAEGQALPSGLAILGLQMNGVLVSEAQMPASRPIASGRVFAEVGPAVNTGLTLTNPNAEAATVSFYFTDANGINVGRGTTTISPKQQIAAFLNDPPFNGGDSILGSFTFTASEPLTAAALRSVTNERKDLLIMMLPIIEVGAAPASNTIAYFADGGGWITEVVLVNPSDAPVNGTVQFLSPVGEIVHATPYMLAPRSSTRVITSGASADTQTGSVRIASPAIALGILSYRLDGVTVTQAGAPMLPAGTSFEMYVETGPAIRSGIAIANPSTTAVDVVLELAGRTATLSVPANGQTARFLDEITGFLNLPSLLQSVLRITSRAPAIVMGLRSHTNDRRESLVTTTAPVQEQGSSSNSELFFPHFAEGGGYGMEFVLFGGPVSGTMYFFDKSGNPVPLLFR